MPSRWMLLVPVVRTALWISGVTAIIAAFCVCMPSWRMHAFNLFWRAWHDFLVTEGSSTVGMLSNLAAPLIAVAITIALIRHHRGQVAMQQHWKEEAAIATRVVIIVALVMYGPVLVWQCVNAVYADHAALRGANQ